MPHCSVRAAALSGAAAFLGSRAAAARRRRASSFARAATGHGLRADVAAADVCVQRGAADAQERGGFRRADPGLLAAVILIVQSMLTQYTRTVGLDRWQAASKGWSRPRRG